MRKSIKEAKKLGIQILHNLRFFWTPWSLLALMYISVIFLDGITMRIVLYTLMGLFVIKLVSKPMNIIYGLIGTRGNIQLFFIYSIIINFLFSGIYYSAFFYNAGITYETNQAHVEFCLPNTTETEIMLNGDEEFLPSTSKDTIHTYHKATYCWVLQNTFLTSLMQEPSDFFSICSTFTGTKQEKCDPNYEMARCFYWFLIFHILISWILLGVFISLIYQKFRNT